MLDTDVKIPRRIRIIIFYRSLDALSTCQLSRKFVKKLVN